MQDKKYVWVVKGYPDGNTREFQSEGEAVEELERIIMETAYAESDVVNEIGFKKIEVGDGH